MIPLADASASVELCADEDDHGAVRALQDVAVAEVSCVEVVAVLWRESARLCALLP